MLVLSAPIHYVLELTPKCNNQCTGCGNVFLKDISPLLSVAQWKKILKKIAPHAANLRLSGGEPTLYPQFKAILDAVASLGISITIFTNGRWQNPDDIIELLNNLPQDKGLLISLHGAIPEIHDNFTGIRGSFNETVKNIKLSLSAGLKVATSTIITSENYNRISDIIKFTEKMEIERAFFARYLPVKNNKIIPAKTQLAEAVNVVEYQRKNGAKAEFSVCIPRCFTSSSSEGCLSGVTYCVIDPWGNVRPCTHSPLITGNLLEQSIEEIWHGKEMQDWRNMIPDQCHECIEFSQCHGGCRAAAILDKLKQDPLMGKPVLENCQELNEKIELYENAYPVGHFTLRSESFGYVLINSNRVIPVTHQSKPVLDVLNGSLTLHSIEECFGQEAISFIGALYQKGFVEFK
ncbi:Radical SAM domain-containing protein [Desulfonema limicola]|uniref:Radical SAM domain-containing protein n=1 Tax=Desulfonema limicola TaxID=45656 RepID=A0A975GKF9_9BACT|nr:radical SAM protein [Desulfonema limicola]QTA83758.1 Radical SAM domain-containing protein [Desulfonema limicola]